MSSVDIALNLKNALERIDAAYYKRELNLQLDKPRLVVASKTQPAEKVLRLYRAGQRHFGENYVKELIEKANDREILEQCPEIKWHFIGHLQSNKINKILQIPNLHVVESVHSLKLAETLDKSWPKFCTTPCKLKVMVQVNTSKEEGKSGIAPERTLDLVKYVLENCPNLELEGLMTIGKFGYNPDDGPNPDFLSLIGIRTEVCEILNLDWRTLHLSMGMSTDYEQAVELGSTSVRVGTAILGERLTPEIPYNCQCNVDGHHC